MRNPLLDIPANNANCAELMDQLGELYNMTIKGREILMAREVVPLEPITSELLNEVRDAIVECIAPDRIILFGSAARQGDSTPHDVDLISSRAASETGVKPNGGSSSSLRGGFLP